MGMKRGLWIAAAGIGLIILFAFVLQAWRDMQHAPVYHSPWGPLTPASAVPPTPE